MRFAGLLAHMCCIRDGTSHRPSASSPSSFQAWAPLSCCWEPAGQADGLKELRTFLGAVLVHAAERASQHERDRYWRGWIHVGPRLPNTPEHIRDCRISQRPHKDTLVLCGFVRNEAHAALDPSYGPVVLPGRRSSRRPLAPDAAELQVSGSCWMARTSRRACGLAPDHGLSRLGNNCSRRRISPAARCRLSLRPCSRNATTPPHGSIDFARATWRLRAIAREAPRSRAHLGRPTGSQVVRHGINNVHAYFISEGELVNSRGGRSYCKEHGSCSPDAGVYSLNS